MIVGIDPGSEQSAYAVIDLKGQPVRHGLVPNEDLADAALPPNFDARVYIEWLSNQGQAVGATTFDTARWIGRFEQQFLDRGFDPTLVPRRDIKLWFLGQPNGRDSQITNAVCDRYGGSLAAAKGVKRAKGPCYGMRSHIWQALAVALYVYERHTTPVSPQAMRA